MAVPNKPIWELPPHTKAKHDILEKYLMAWIPILGQTHQRIVYIDGFAGPGIYRDGEPGSPVIALRCAREHQHRIHRMTAVFIEKDENRFACLEEQVSSVDHTENIEPYCIRGEFEDTVVSLLDDLESDGDNLAPTLAFIDPFGFSGVPVELLCKILSYPSTEVFVNYAIDSLNRFAEHPEASIRSEIKRTIGQELPEPKSPRESRQNRLRRAYAGSLNSCADFVRSFEMYDQSDRPKYDLFFASNNPRGHEKMKAAMWAVDPTGDFRFSDATDSHQTVLFNQDPVPQLLKMILAKFSSKGKVTCGEIEQWVLNSTPFLKKHKTGALTEGENSGLYLVRETKVDGSRRSGGFPDGVIIDFDRAPGTQGELML
jgi:three-Cys-motif partner protein